MKRSTARDPRGQRPRIRQGAVRDATVNAAPPRSRHPSTGTATVNGTRRSSNGAVTDTVNRNTYQADVPQTERVTVTVRDNSNGDITRRVEHRQASWNDRPSPARGIRGRVYQERIRSERIRQTDARKAQQEAWTPNATSLLTQHTVRAAQREAQRLTAAYQDAAQHGAQRVMVHESVTGADGVERSVLVERDMHVDFRTLVRMRSAARKAQHEADVLAKALADATDATVRHVKRKVDRPDLTGADARAAATLRRGLADATNATKPRARRPKG